MKIGIISDTHGRLAEKVLDVLDGIDVIFHAGDIGSLSVVDALESVAPVFGVCGNMDGIEIAKRFPRRDLVELAGECFYIIHEPYLLDIDPKTAGVDCVIFGHTHIPLIEKRDGVLFINPGSASVPKYKNPPTVAVCEIKEGSLKPSILSL